MIGFAEEGWATDSDETDFTARAIGIDAAFRAEAGSVEVVAADEAVATVELRSVVCREDSARRTFRMAAIVTVDTGAITALLALAAFAVADAIEAVGARTAIAIVTAFSARGAGFGFTAEQTGAANDGFITGIGLAKGAIRADFILAAGADRHAVAVAAFLPLAAFALANTQRAIAALTAVVVVAAFGAIAAFGTWTAKEIVATGALRAGAIGYRAGISRFSATGSIRNTLAFNTDFAGVRDNRRSRSIAGRSSRH